MKTPLSLGQKLSSVLANALASALPLSTMVGGAVWAQDSGPKIVISDGDPEPDASTLPRGAPGEELSELVDGVPPGFMIIESDIVVPENFFTRGTFVTSLWPGTPARVPFRFDANVTPAHQAAMIAAMAEWEAVANVDFVARSGQADFVHIRESNGNNSRIGRVGGQQVINIVSWNSRFIIVHELGHALGYWHEQSRADRGTFIRVNYNNVSDTACDGGPCDDNFDIRPRGDEYGPYDFDSVMHYGQCDFSKCPSCPNSSTATCADGGRTIIVLPPNTAMWQNAIGNRTHLSVMDRLTMSFLYRQANWWFLDRTYTGTTDGTFLKPYKSFSAAKAGIPVAHDLWIQPGNLGAVGVHSKTMILHAPLGDVRLGNFP